MMDKRHVISFLLVLIYFVSLSYSKELPKKNIPQELQLLGFTQEKLVDYRRAKGNIEYFTFFDWTTERKGDTITFIVERGQITGKFKDKDRKDSGRDI
ncbi:MAG: hypothetical protein WCI77_07750 [Candidatus Omnitrophota bacterium]